MSKQVKALLKEIRSLLDDHQYMAAMKKCNKVLKEDINNYMAVVMLAAAVKEIEEFKCQTPAILKKAIEMQPTNSLAWKGLLNYYEKEEDTEEIRNGLIPVYCKLLELDSDATRFLDYLSKLSNLIASLKDSSSLSEAILILSKIRGNIETANSIKIDDLLLMIFKKFPKMERINADIYTHVLLSIIQNNNTSRPETQLKCFKIYLKHIYAKKRFTELFATAATMHEKYPHELSPLEWICRVYGEQTVMSDLHFGENLQIEHFYKALLELDSSSYLAIFAKAMHFWQNNDIIEARDLLNQVVLLNRELGEAWVALCDINSKLRCWSEVENTVQSAQPLITSKAKILQRKTNISFIESLMHSGDTRKWHKAVEECEKMLSKGPDTRIQLFLARLKMQLDHPDADSFLTGLENDPEARIEVTIIRALALKKRKCFDEALDMLGTALETSEAWQMFGEINWSMSNYSHSLMAFLKGIHADPFNWHCFLFLGHYYREQNVDLEKSRKCYQKALRINPNSEEAGAGLSTAYRLQKNTEANMQMLQRVTTAEGGGPKWAWLQLGLQQLDEGEIAQAIKSLRFVIRADPNDNHCWESLADAYWARGAHTSALKSYQRALELSPGSLYPMIQLANIKLVIRRLDEAKEAFLQVLSQEQKYIPALKGLAETCLGLAKEHAANQLLGRSKREAQLALDSLTEAITINSNFSCLWKLLGDVAYRVATLPDKYCFLEVVPGLVKSRSKDERVRINRNELFILSARSYCRALSLFKDSSLLWHDLACCYVSQLELDPAVNRKLTAEKCLEAAKQAVRLCPTSWAHWNLLGVICVRKEIKNYALAQHCWVMALDKEENNAIAWTNLGTLYWHLNDYRKANRAFSGAQRADPDYQNCWIGQAMIAEYSQGDRMEAVDLYRHAVQLGYHSQAAIGYAYGILTTILDPEARKNPLYNYVIVNMHAVTLATDVMTWFVERESKSAVGRNILGLLLERQKLWRPAAHEFQEALKLVEGDDDKESQARANLARILVQMGEFEEAIEICQGIKHASFNSHCQLALAFFKAGKYEESYAAYEAALNWLADAGSEKAYVLCAMASMAYMFQSIDDVKTLLFQCIQIQPPIVSGLLAAAALGLLHDDDNLTTLVLKELEPYKDDPNYRHHVAVLSGYLCLMHEDVEGAIRVVSKAIFRRPDDVGLWVGLVRILLETNSNDFGNCAQKALHFGRKSDTVAVAQVACVSSLGQLIDDWETQSKKGLRAVQKIIHSFPGNIESWANLIVALSPRGKQSATPNASWLSSLIQALRTNLKISKPMDEWLLMNEEKLTNMVPVIS